MADAHTTDLMLRTATVALAWATMIAIVLRAGRTRIALYAAFVAGGIAAFMIASAPGAHHALGPVAIFFNAWCIATPAVVWLLALALFRDRAEAPGPWVLAAVGALVAITLVGDYGRFQLGILAAHPQASQWMLWTGRAAEVGLVLAACAMAIAHWREDLVEERRRVRALFVAVFGCAFLALASSEFVFGGRGAPIEWLLAGHALLLAVTFAILQAFVGGGLGGLLGEPAPRKSHAPLTLVHTDPADAALAQRVVEAMQARRLWKRDGLAIADLAAELGTQEYRLRRAINRHLGYRNFNDFLHEYRLEEAARRLADREEDHLPVLTIALDCGYGSIGPFNRAFKARFGVTPTQYRNLRNRPDPISKSASQPRTP